MLLSLTYLTWYVGSQSRVFGGLIPPYAHVLFTLILQLTSARIQLSIHPRLSK